MTRRVFVTRGSGVVGGTPIAAPSRRGDGARALARPAAAEATARAADALPVGGDLVAHDALRRGMAGRDLVAPAAGAVDVGGTRGGAGAAAWGRDPGRPRRRPRRRRAAFRARRRGLDHPGWDPHLRRGSGRPAPAAARWPLLRHDSGGPPAARARTLTTMGGGSQPVARRCEPPVGSFSRHVVYPRGPGSGQTAKPFTL